MVATVLRGIVSFLTFGITLPLWAILGAALWFHLDKTSAVRLAVDNAVTELVAGAELQAERARASAANLILERERGRAEALERINAEFSKSVEQMQQELESANDRLRELQDREVDPLCTVDDFVFDRLRNR